MTNKNFWLGMLVLALVFEMTVVGCGDGTHDLGLNGTWVGTSGTTKYTLKLHNGNLETWIGGVPYAKGTYTTKDETFTSKTTHLHGSFSSYASLGFESKWYSKNEYEAVLRNYYKQLYPNGNNEQIDRLLSSYLTVFTTTTTSAYERKGKTLYIRSMKYTKE